MPWTVIKRFDYRTESQELLILFTTGRRYLYEGVPPDVVAEFKAAFSKGVHFNRYIRDRYRYREIVGE